MNSNKLLAESTKDAKSVLALSNCYNPTKRTVGIALGIAAIVCPPPVHAIRAVNSRKGLSTRANQSHGAKNSKLVWRKIESSS